MSGMPRARLADELVRRLAAALRGAQLYAPDHPLVTRSLTALADTLTLAHATVPSLTIGIGSFDRDVTGRSQSAGSLFYVNGSRLQTIYSSGLDPNEALNLQTMRHFVVGNREIGGRSIEGMIYYAAIYNVALTPAQVLQNAQLLLVNDDTVAIQDAQKTKSL